MITNRHGLPAPLVNAIANDPYSRGDSDISVTQLISPPQMRKLMTGREVTEDASECIWRLLGSAVHVILERGYYPEDPESPDASRMRVSSAIVERRLFAEVLGQKVSGAFDVYDNGTLSDYKITSVFAHGKVKPEWLAQLNLLAALARRNNMPVTKLEIVAIWRDWRPREAQYDADYPQAQVSVVPIPLWTEAEAEAYLEERVRLHQLDSPPPCTDEERWAQPNVYAIMQKKRKRAVKLFDTVEALNKYAMDRDYLELTQVDDDFQWLWTGGYYSEHRPGAYRRCESYCSAADICPQLQAERKAA